MRDYAELVKAARSSARWIMAKATESSFAHDELKALHHADAVFEVADAIEELLAELVTTRNQLPKWVSVEELLPSRYETVLLNIQTCKDSYVTIGDYEPNELRFRDFADRNNQVYCGDIVTHWMPLPKAPEPLKEDAE